MKIVQVNAYYGNGSTGNIVKQILETSNKKNIDCYAVYWLGKNKDEYSKKILYCGENKKRSIYIKFLHYCLLGGKIAYNKNRTKKIIETIKNINPDIIHLHNLHGDFEYGSIDLPYFFTELSKMKKKVIWTFHDCWPITGRCYHFEYSRCNKWKTGCLNCPQRFYDRHGIFWDYAHKNWIIKRELYQNIEDLTIVTVSNWLKKIVENSMLKSRKIITIYNGVDTNIFKEKLLPKNKNIQILGIGWDRKKGYKKYLEISKFLFQNEKLIVVGKQPIFRKFFKLPDNIITIDYIDDPLKLAKLYCQSDIYFNPSVAETFGLTTVESMACGTPVLGYARTATPEIIGECGIIYAKENFKKIMQEIREINTNKTIKEKCRQRVEENFSLSKMLRNYLDLYLRN